MDMNSNTISTKNVSARLLLLVFLCNFLFVLFPVQARGQAAPPSTMPPDTTETDAIFRDHPYYQDATGTECLPSGVSQNNTGTNTYVLGDSISYGLHEDGIEQKLSEKLGGETKVNYDGGRSITAPGFQVKTSALDAVDDDAEYIKTAKTIIIVLGTNLGDDPFDQKMNELLTKLRSHAPGANYFWVDIGATGAKSAETWSARNRIIYEQASSKNYAVISRYKAIFGPDADPLNITAGQNFPGLADEDVATYGAGNVHGAYAELSAAILEEVDKPSSTPTATSASGCVCQGGPIVQGSEAKAIVWNYLVGEMSFTAIQAAGAMGNIEQESGFNPLATYPGTTSETPPPGDTAWGLIQWTAGRKRALVEFANQQNKNPNQLDVQLDYMKLELEGAYRSNVLEPMLSATTLEESTLVWLEHYEVPCPNEETGTCEEEMLRRLPFAQAYLTEFGSVSPSSSPSGASCITNGNGDIVGGMSLPVDRKWFDENPQWFTSTHHSNRAAIDMGMPTGTPVYSMTAGTVIRAPNGTLTGGYGLGVTIDAGDGIIINYGHGSDGGAVEGAREGDTVQAGQLIFHSAGTGSSTAPHLHIDISIDGVNNSHCPQPLLKGIYDGSPPRIRSLPTSGCTHAASPW